MMKVEFPRELRRKMLRNLNRAGWREIGGVLMAEQLADGHFRIADFSVDPRTGTGAHFVRDPKHHDAALSAFFERTGKEYSRFNYLGEWHSHPNFPAIPSGEDRLSMLDLVESEASIPFSLLLVVRSRWRVMLELSAALFQRGGHVSEVDFG